MEALDKAGLALSSKKGDPRNTKAYRRARVKVLNRDGHVCMYCGSTDELTIDHVLSVKNHPELSMDLDNMVIACKSCNSRKGSRSQGVFLAQKDTPPIFPSFISPKRSEPVEDSPFTARPMPN
jgi:5-methylcytosine-specific restriction endonuclease McrA